MTADPIREYVLAAIYGRVNREQLWKTPLEEVDLEAMVDEMVEFVRNGSLPRKAAPMSDKHSPAGYIDNGTSAYTCQECWVEVRFTHIGQHDAWHRRLKQLIDGTP